MVPRFGHPPHLLQHPAGDGSGVAGPLYLEQVIHIVQVGGTGDQVAAVGLLLENLDDLVMFVPNLTHQLLQDVLQGDDTLGTAVLVHHHRHVYLVLLQDTQQLKGLGVASGVEHRGFEVGHHGLPPVPGGVKVLLVDKAHDVVNGLMVDRDAGVACLGKEGGQLLHGALLLGGSQVHPGGEQLGDLQVVELNGVADQVTLVLVQAALVLRLVHHAHQLLLGDAVVPLGAEDPAHQLFPLAEQEV